MFRSRQGHFQVRVRGNAAEDFFYQKASERQLKSVFVGGEL